jgi:hypothetical protein
MLTGGGIGGGIAGGMWKVDLVLSGGNLRRVFGRGGVSRAQSTFEKDGSGCSQRTVWGGQCGGGEASVEA